MQIQSSVAVAYLAEQYEQIKKAMAEYPVAAEKIWLDVAFDDGVLTVYGLGGVIDKKRLWLKRYLLDEITNIGYSVNQTDNIVWVCFDLLRYVNEMSHTGLEQYLSQYYSPARVAALMDFYPARSGKKLAMRALPLPISNEICEYLF